LTSNKPCEYEGQVGYALELPDAVATMLVKVSKEALVLFLNARTKSFKIVQSY
jgi:hypothetical protein